MPAFCHWLPNPKNAGSGPDYAGRISDELKTIMEFPGFTADNMSRFKERYAALGPTPSNTRYGWMRTIV